MFKSNDWEFFYYYTSKKKELCDVIGFNEKEKRLCLSHDVKKSMLDGVDSDNVPYRATNVSKTIFSILDDALMDEYGGAEAVLPFVKIEYSSYEKDEKHKISKETAYKAIHRELSYDELAQICQKPIQEADYYDFDAFMSGIKAFIDGKMPRDAYIDWLIIVSWALNSNTLKPGTSKEELYDSLAMAFDGHSFLGTKDELAEARWMIRTLKEINHKLKHIDKKKIPPFYNDGKIIVYDCFDHCNSDNEFYKICVVDDKRKAFKIAYLHNVDYLDDVNYTELSSREFNNLTSKYYEYYEDKDIDISKYIREGRYEARN